MGKGLRPPPRFPGPARAGARQPSLWAARSLVPQAAWRRPPLPWADKTLDLELQAALELRGATRSGRYTITR